MPAILTFGEIMLRLTTPGYQRFAQAPHFEATFGGAEANVAVAIATLGGSAGYLTRLPENDLADRALAELRALNVDVSTVVRGGERLGVYFLEQGISQRAGKVIYDRAHSSMATARPEHFDWDTVFAPGVQWFHWSGITPALSAETAALVGEACKAARERGLIISFDLNYRGKLWTPQQAGATLAPLMQYVDLCITSAEEARTVFGIPLPAAAPDLDEQAARKLVEHFGFKAVALTQRAASSAEVTEWGALLYMVQPLVPGSRGDSNQPEFHRSRRHQVTIVDRLGAGDSFSGTLIFGLHRGDHPGQALELAVAASALKHTIPGDFNRATLEEAEALAAGAGGGRVRR